MAIAYPDITKPDSFRADRKSNSGPAAQTLQPFGAIGAARYDEDTRRMPRRYHTAHAIQNKLVRRALGIHPVPDPVVVDLGCGTGNDALNLLSRRKDLAYLGVDYSSHMLTRAAAKLARSGHRQRAILLHRDFRQVASDEILAALDAAGLGRQIRCVISAIALHHYTVAEKKPVYRLAFDLLPKSGLLVLSDLYSTSISYAAEMALSQELFDIRTAARRIKTFNRKCRGPSTISERHYREENQPQVLAEEISALQETGFDVIEVIYRSAQLAVLAAQKN
jgi:SAM-dependent methyltransferase